MTEQNMSQLISLSLQMSHPLNFTDKEKHIARGLQALTMLTGLGSVMAALGAELPVNSGNLPTELVERRLDDLERGLLALGQMTAGLADSAYADLEEAFRIDAEGGGGEYEKL